MPLKFNTANGAIIVSAEDGSGDAAVTFPRSNLVGEAHTGNVSITGDLTTTGTFDHTGNAVVSGEFIADSYNEKLIALGTLQNTVDIDLETGNFFSGALYGNTTFTFSNPPASGTAYSFTLSVGTPNFIGPYTITWPASVEWSGGSAPDAPATNERDIFVFTTHNGGVIWYGFQAGAALA